jgi:hypothetical protein
MTKVHSFITADRASGVPKPQTPGAEVVQEASGGPVRASDARSPDPVTPVDPSRDWQVVRRCGRFMLTRSPEGLRWVLMSQSGWFWHWHAEGCRWLAKGRAYRTEAEATAGLEETLAHEQAGDLDEQHVAPPLGGVRDNSSSSTAAPTC